MLIARKDELGLVAERKTVAVTVQRICRFQLGPILSIL